MNKVVTFDKETNDARLHGRPEFECVKFSCRMLYRACLLRQQRAESHRRLIENGGAASVAISSLEACLCCDQGRFIRKKFNLAPPPVPPRRKRAALKNRPCIMPNCTETGAAPLCGRHKKAKSSSSLLAIDTKRSDADQITALVTDIYLYRPADLFRFAAGLIDEGLDLYDKDPDAIQDVYPSVSERSLTECKIFGCKNEVHGCNLCRRHYQAARTGRLLRIHTADLTMEETEALIIAIGRVAVAKDFSFSQAVRALAFSSLRAKNQKNRRRKKIA